MKVKLSYIMAVGLAAGIGYWMSSGTVVIGGVGDGENARTASGRTGCRKRRLHLPGPGCQADRARPTGNS